jgi:hypothetical protein
MQYKNENGVNGYSEKEWAEIVQSINNFYEENAETLQLLHEMEEDGYPEEYRGREYHRMQYSKHPTKKNHGSRFQKGYHKYEKHWKRTSRRSNRHSAKSEIINYQPRINWDAIREYIISQELQSWDDTYINWIGFDQWVNTITGETIRGISALCYSEYNDLDDYTYRGNTDYYFSFKDLIKMGFAE